MSNIFAFRSFREFVRNCFALRQYANPSYSLRQFAKDLGMSHSRLSEILSSPTPISLGMAAKMAQGLRLKANERDFFMDLVRAECSRSIAERSEANQRLQDHFGRRSFHLEHDQEGGLLSKWYYLGLIEMLTKVPPTADNEIQKILGIDEQEFVAAKQFLLAHKIVAPNKIGGHKKSNSYLKFESTVPSRLIRNFHASVLTQAQKAIEAQKIAERKYISTFFGLRKATLEEARKELESFNQRFIKKYTSENAADSVYCFSLQLFRFDQENT